MSLSSPNFAVFFLLIIKKGQAKSFGYRAGREQTKKSINFWCVCVLWPLFKIIYLDLNGIEYYCPFGVVMMAIAVVVAAVLFSVCKFS